MKKKWERRPVFGAWCTVGSPAAVELMVDVGYDFLILDCQHGEFDVAALESHLRAFTGSETTPAVRVPHNSYFSIGRALDAGAHTVIVPMVNTREEAEQAVEAARYHPEGSRSWAGTRAGRSLTIDPPAVNDAVGVMVMLETATGVSNVEAIAATPGLDGIFVGPADLALTLGRPPREDPPVAELEAAVDAVAAACARHSIVAGIAGGVSFAARGYRVMMLDSDRFLLSGGRSGLDAARAASAG